MSPTRRVLLPFLGRKGGYQRKLLACFLLVSFALFFPFALLVLRAADSRYRAELQEMGRRTIAQARNTCDTLLLEVFRYGLELVTDDPDLIRLMYSPTFESSDAVAAQNLLANMQRYNAYVNNIYIINFASGGVLTRTGRVQLETFYDPALIEFVEALPVSSVPVRYMPRVATVRDNASRLTEERVWSVIFRSGTAGAFVLNVNYDDFTGLLNMGGDGKLLDNYIINGDGQVLVASDGDLFAADMTDDPLYAAVRAQPDREGSFSFTRPDSGMSCTVYYIQNAYLGLTYISAVPNTLFGAGNALFFTILGWSLLFLLLSAVGSVLLAGLVYRPVRSLTSELHLQAPEEGRDEFDQFRAAYAAMQEHNDELRTTAQRAEERRMLLKWADPAAVGKKYRAEEYEALESYFVHRFYCCVLFSIDAPPDLPHPEQELNLLRYSITNMLEELAEGQFLLRSLDYTARQTLHICNFEETAQCLRPALETVQRVLRQHFRVTATVAVGLTVPDTDDLPQSLQSARRAVERRFANGAGTLTFCDDTPLPAAQQTAYPQDEETRLLQAARTGAKADLPDLLRDFFDRLRPYPLGSILLYLLQLDLACQKLEAATHLDQQPLDVNDLAGGAQTLDDLQARFAARLTAVADAAAAQRGSNAEKLVTTLHTLVEENLCDPNLSVAYLADRVNLSVNYLRNVYKEATGESLSGYITSAKLGLICHLLQTSDMTIQQVSDTLGFTTRNYFFTFFKKHTGMTPKQYRLLQGNLQD